MDLITTTGNARDEATQSVGVSPRSISDAQAGQTLLSSPIENPANGCHRAGYERN
jgi:hypothetical protein